MKMKIEAMILGFITAFVTMAAATTLAEKRVVLNFSSGFDEQRDTEFFEFPTSSASIDGGALQLTPDTTNQQYTLLNKSGRILWHEPITLWRSSGDVAASFISNFVINIYSQTGWKIGEGFTFLIVPDLTIPDTSYGQWMGLTNASIDGDIRNQIVAVEFDTQKQDFDPDDNHIGVNVNSVHSNKTIPLGDMKISQPNGSDYEVWVQYDGPSKLMEVYMVENGSSKPNKPVLSYEIDLKLYVKQKSYFGFSGSTGDPDIQLNCVKKWVLEVDKMPGNGWPLWLKVGCPILIFMVVVTCLVVLNGVKKMSKHGSQGGVLDSDPNVVGTLERLLGAPRRFRYRDLKKATNNFDEKMVLGRGGFGVVYRGVLSETHHHHTDTTTTSVRDIAVKKFTRDNIKSQNDFVAELSIINRLRHKNLVPLVGWCYEEGKLLLVYDYMPNGSLDTPLFKATDTNNLSWDRRYRIITGVASALHYLHNEYDQKVLHRDIKASNIMLDADFNARLGDFGLARALDKERTSYTEHGQAGFPGTFGYIAPECFHNEKATSESDVYSFGAVVLEVVCGRSPGTKIESCNSLVDWVWMLHREKRILEAVDPRLGNDFLGEVVERLLLLGLACSHPIASQRPKMDAILQMISGALSPPHVPPFKPYFYYPSRGVQSTNSETTDSTLSNTMPSIGL